MRLRPAIASPRPRPRRLRQHAPEALRGTGDLGVVIERAAGRVQIVEHSTNSSLATVPGLGDLSHAHVTFSRDGRFAYVFGRDGGLTKVDLLARRIDKRIIQAGNSIGGSISQDGRLIVAQNYEPGGIKAFDADTLELLSEVPAEYAPGKFSKVVGLADVSGQRLCMPSSRPARSGSPTSPTRAARHHPLPGRQAALRRPRHPRRALLPGRPVRRGRHLAARPVAARARRQRSSPATAAASKSCRSSRCPTCAAGRWPAGRPGCPPSAATRCSSPTPAAGRRPPACRSRASRCS
jgi:hypothetical protein